MFYVLYIIYIFRHSFALALDIYFKNTYVHFCRSDISISLCTTSKGLFLIASFSFFFLKFAFFLTCVLTSSLLEFSQLTCSFGLFKSDLFAKIVKTQGFSVAQFY